MSGCEEYHGWELGAPWVGLGSTIDWCWEHCGQCYGWMSGDREKVSGDCGLVLECYGWGLGAPWWVLGVSSVGVRNTVGRCWRHHG